MRQKMRENGENEIFWHYLQRFQSFFVHTIVNNLSGKVIFWELGSICLGVADGVLSSALSKSLYFEYSNFVLVTKFATFVLGFELLRSFFGIRLVSFHCSLVFHGFFPIILQFLFTMLNEMSISGVWAPGFERILTFSPIICAFLCSLVDELPFSRRTQRQAVALILVTCLPYYALKFHDVESLNAWAFHISFLAVFAQLIAWIQLKNLLKRYGPLEVLYTQQCCYFFGSFAAEVYLHSIRGVSEYLIRWRFPFLFPVWAILLLVSPLYEYFRLKSLQMTDPPTLAVLSNIKISLQIFFSYGLSKYVYHQSSWEHFDSHNFLMAATASSAGFYYLLRKKRSLMIKNY
ncbi:unnamed protein product, partial [Mesorhabditis belari]|uniref:Uncharacterized protein n=1 Tax=Mesorhabditis belari TaxID=2138241 RepID=A0AAF3JAD6_9BILA